MADSSTNMRLRLPLLCIILEVILIILFGTLVEYNHDTDAKLWNKNRTGPRNDYENEFYYRYPSK